jgi:acyl carrier protein
MSEEAMTENGPGAEDIERWLAELVGSVLDVPARHIDVQMRFDRYGIDSAVGVSLISELEKYLDRELDPMLIYDFPTIRALARHLAGG